MSKCQLCQGLFFWLASLICLLSEFSCFSDQFHFWYGLLLYTMSYSQENRLTMNTRLKKLQEKVKKQSEKVGKKLTTLIIKYPISYYHLLWICISTNHWFRSHFLSITYFKSMVGRSSLSNFTHVFSLEELISLDHNYYIFVILFQLILGVNFGKQCYVIELCKFKQWEKLAGMHLNELAILHWFVGHWIYRYVWTSLPQNGRIPFTSPKIAYYITITCD